MTSRILCACLFFLSCSFLTNGQSLVESSFLESRTKEELTVQLGGFIPVLYDADFYKILYTTNDLEGQPDTASGAIIIPRARELALPLHIDQHGTAPSKESVPSAGEYGTAPFNLLLSHIVIAPDLLGLGESRGFHPFVHAASEASAAVDMLFAAKEFLDQLGVPYNDQLFISGYSQGGHASAALQRELETNFSDQVTVTAAAHMAGPHSISGEMVDILLAEEPYALPSFYPYAMLGMNLAYDLFDDPADLLKDPYAGFTRQFSDWSIDLFELNTLISDQLILDHGQVIPRYMFQDSLLAILESKDPEEPFVAALMDNDLLDWVPKAPTRFIHCSGDDLIPFQNSVLADSTMNANNAEDVELVNPSRNSNHLECVVNGPAIFSLVNFFAPFRDIQTNVFDPDLPEVSIFPNPTSSRLWVTNVPVGIHAELISLEGKQIRQLRFTDVNQAIEVADLPNGMYILRMSNDEVSISRKVMIRR